MEKQKKALLGLSGAQRLVPDVWACHVLLVDKALMFLMTVVLY